MFRFKTMFDVKNIQSVMVVTRKLIISPRNYFFHDGECVNVYMFALSLSVRMYNIYMYLQKMCIGKYSINLRIPTQTLIENYKKIKKMYANRD